MNASLEGHVGAVGAHASNVVLVVAEHAALLVVGGHLDVVAALKHSNNVRPWQISDLYTTKHEYQLTSKLICISSYRKLQNRQSFLTYFCWKCLM